MTLSVQKTVPVQSTEPAVVSGHFVRNAIRKAVERGHDTERLLKQCDVPAAVLAHDAYLPVSNYARLLQLTVTTMGDEIVGYGLSPYKRGVWRSACRAALHAGSLGQALERLCEFYCLFDAGPQVRLVVEGAQATLSAWPSRATPDQELFVYELALSTFHRFASWAVKQPLPLRSVSFMHPRPVYADNYGWLFPHCPIVFDGVCAALRFDRHWLDQPVTQDVFSLEAWLDRSFPGLLGNNAGPSRWSDRLMEMVEQSLPTVPEFARLAADLDIHPQTLRRRLAVEGLTYQDIKDRARRGAAEYYLREANLSLEEIAFRAGFSEASCLIRAFKRWNGVTPHTYAERQRNRYLAAG